MVLIRHNEFELVVSLRSHVNEVDLVAAVNFLDEEWV
jgi:hypothetical protein